MGRLKEGIDENLCGGESHPARKGKPSIDMPFAVTPESVHAANLRFGRPLVAGVNSAIAQVSGIPSAVAAGGVLCTTRKGYDCSDSGYRGGSVIAQFAPAAASLCSAKPGKTPGPQGL